MKRKTHDEFINEIKNINPFILVIGTYVNCSTKIEVKCLKCNHIWNAVPNSLIQGHGCPACANNQKKTHQQFVSEMQTYNPYIKVLGEYKTATTPLRVKCTICGNEWLSKPNRLLNGAQCQNCTKPHTSFMEQFMLISFQDAIGEESVESRNTSAIGLELDIYVPNYKLAIEPGTWLYHKNKVGARDLDKRKKCQEVGIRLVTVYDTFPAGENPPYESDCYVFDGFLNEPGYKRLIAFLTDLMSSVNINSSDLDWAQIANRAYAACHYNAHESFVKTLAERQPNIEVLEKYKGVNIPITVNNKNCGHPTWKARPYTLLKGIGCPECGRSTAAKTRTRSHQDFEIEMLQINPTIEILGKYTKVTERIEVRCKKCGYNWKPLGYSLLSGKGCPHCSALTGAKKRKNSLSVKTTEQFKKELFAINRHINVLGEYINNKTKISVECLVCGNKWDVVPASLLNGHGCPQCAKEKRKTIK